MTQEQKAKAYDELIAKLIKAKEDDMLNDERYCCVIDEIVPELKESEDERIRKELISFVRNNGWKFIRLTKEEKESWIAWIEKQSQTFTKKDVDDAYLKGINDAKNELEKQSKETKIEQAMREVEEKAEAFTEAHKGETSEEILAQMKGEKKVNFTKIIGEPRKATGVLKEMWDEMKSDNESKFKVGDWIVSNINKDIFLIKSVNSGYYTLEDVKGRIYTPCLPPTEDDFHLWNIKDAKNGDVLFQDLMGGKTFIYNGVNPDMAILYSFIISNDGEDVLPYHIGKPNTGIGNIEENKNIIHPATKEQRDTFFAKMKDTGYEWDADKKELKKIEQIPNVNNESSCNEIPMYNAF